MNTENLEAFLAVCQHRSVSLAAEHLHLTQPAVSKRLKSLEQQLGCTLFDRIARSLSLTPQGHALLPKATAIVNQIEDAERAVRSLSEQIVGPLRLATSHHIGLHHLPLVLKSFNLRFPQVKLEIEFIDSSRAIDAIQIGQAEIAIVTLDEKLPETMSATPLWEDPLLVVAHNDHPLAFMDNPTLQDLSQYPAILPDESTITSQIIAREFEKSGIELLKGLTTNYLETIKMMVSIGLGWSALPKVLMDNQLTEINLPEFSPVRQLGYITHSQRTLSNAANAFIEEVQHSDVQSP